MKNPAQINEQGSKLNDPYCSFIFRSGLTGKAKIQFYNNFAKITSGFNHLFFFGLYFSPKSLSALAMS